MTILRRLSFVLALFLTTTSIQGANDVAVIKHKLINEESRDTDASVVVKRINNTPIAEIADRTMTPAGEQLLEVECLVRLFVGMGTVDFSNVTQMGVKLEDGKTYQLGAIITATGGCQPTIQ